MLFIMCLPMHMKLAKTSSSSDENDAHCTPRLTCVTLFIQSIAYMKRKEKNMRLCCTS